MNVKYHKSFECEINHTYFSDGVSSIFSLVPLKETARILKNYDILLEKQQHLFSFYTGLKAEDTFEIDTQFSGVSNLYFQLVADDPSFFSYTNVKARSESQVYYFSNENTTKEQQQLHDSNGVTAQDLISLKPQIFNVEIPSGEFHLQVKRSSGEVVIDEQMSKPQKLSYTVDLRSHENGRYELWLNDKIHEQFFMSNEQLPSNCIGVVQLNIDVLQKNYVSDLRYSIQFNSQSAYWRYKVVVADSRKINVVDMRITGVEDEIYGGPIDQEIIGGQAAQIFTSKTPMALHKNLEEHPQLIVSYANGFSNRTNELEIKLPNPGIENITMNNNEENEKSFFSSTIVYV